MSEEVSVLPLETNGVDSTSPEMATVSQPSNPVVDENKPAEKSELELLMEKIKPSKSGKKQNYSRIDISADKWFLTLDPEAFRKLSDPPSLADGLEIKEERELRLLGCELIQSGAILLRLPQTAAATGQILFQRYYYQKSFVRFNFMHTVMACLVLASRIEEAPRRPRDVINVVNRLKQLIQNKCHGRDRKHLVYMRLDKNYVELKNLVIKTERRLLNVLGFVVHVHHPHKLIISYGHVLGLNEKRKDILIKAWNYMNDGLRTDIFLRYRAETIACACLYLAARTVPDPVRLPKEPKPWYELYDCQTSDVESISLILLNLYNNQRVPNYSRLSQYVEKLYKERYGKTEKEKPVPTITIPDIVKDKLAEKKKDERKRSRSRERSRDRDRRDRRERGRDSKDKDYGHGRSRRDRDDRRDRDRDRDRREKRRSRSPTSRSTDKRRDRDRQSHKRRRSQTPSPNRRR